MNKTKMEKGASKPAGKKEKIDVTYTGFAADQERTELKVDEGHEFDNDALLQMLGFEKDASGQLVLPASDYEAEIAPNGEIIRRKKGDKVLTESMQSEER